MFIKQARYMKRLMQGTFFNLFLCACIFSVVCFGRFCFAAESAPPPVSSVSIAPSEAAKQIAELIENGKWTDAEALLKQQNATDNQQFQVLSGILADYRQIEAVRMKKQAEIYESQYSKAAGFISQIEKNDPNLNYQQAFTEIRSLWREATDAQKKNLCGQPFYSAMMQHAQQQAQLYTAAGNWQKAWSEGVKWLTTFEPKNPDYLKRKEQLEYADALEDMLKPDPCDGKSDRYLQVRLDASQKAFQILAGYYVEPVDFGKTARAVLEECALLSRVVRIKPERFAYRADPNGFEKWDSGIGALQSDIENHQGSFDVNSMIGLLNTLIALNTESIKLSEGLVIALVTKAALRELDPYTEVVWPFNIDEFDKEMTGKFGGIGVRIRKDKDTLVIVSLVANTPAAKSDLQADDIIIAVDGELTKDMSTTCAVKKISGPIGTSVTLTIRREGQEKDKLVSVMRDKIVLPVIEGSQRADNGKTEGRWDYFLDKDSRIGYLHLSQFTDRTIEQMQSALEQLEKEGLRGLIVDLRGNGGGILESAVGVSDLFLDDEGLILRTEGRGAKKSQWNAHPDNVKRLYPLVFLMDDTSASASEIVAGVLGPSYDRATLVGGRSYGKGTVQEVVDLDQNGTRLKFTASYYHLANGEPVKNRFQLIRAGREDWGIRPDIEVPLFNFEVEQISDVSQLRRSFGNPSDGDKDVKDSIGQKMISADPQLALAVLAIKAKCAVQN